MVVVTVAYLVVGALFAIRTPDWQTPDEPAHVNYIRQIAEEGRLPVIETGDWDQPYLEALKSARFSPELLGDLEAIEYEDHQPPLYYLLGAPVYALTDGSLTALRLYSVLLGLLIVWCAAGVGWLMFPARPWIGIGTAAFVAFQPQHVHILASVNNDALGWAVVAVGLLLTVAYLKEARVLGVVVRPWMLGLVLGVGFITKSTTYFMAGVMALAIFLHWWSSSPREVKVLLRRGAAFLLPALIFGLLWWGRNLSVYGFPDFLGLAAHDVVVADQARTADEIERLGFGGYLRALAQTTFNSFWAQFGWMGVPLQSVWYTGIAALLVFALSGLAVDAVVLRREGAAHAQPEQTTPQQRHVWMILSLTALLAVLAFLYYNTEFLQFQGRYMFPLLIPLGIWLALGVDAWWRVLIMRLPTPEGTWLRWGSGGLFLTVALVDIWLLWRVVVPNLQP
ncbi:MAG: glycosyltransferase family 39 protein [Anaerolineae bacterium]